MGGPWKVFWKSYLSWIFTQMFACMYVVNNYLSSKNLLFSLLFFDYFWKLLSWAMTFILFILLHVKDVRHPRSGKVDTRLHMSMFAYFKDVNHSLGGLLLWNKISMLLDCSLSYWYLMCQVKILVWWTRRQHGDFLALFPANLTGCIVAGAQQSD